MERIWILVIAACASCDIFHSTDFRVESGANDAGVVPFTTDSAKALEYAKTTCAWLSACESPLGNNQAGVCIANAILAYDRTINPNRAPKGAAKTYWQCIFDAAAKQSCAAIRACVYPLSPSGLACSGVFVGCSVVPGPTRIDCRMAAMTAAPAENCIASGQSCVAKMGNFGALCAGAQGQACATAGCIGTSVSACSDAGVDIGQDCALVGAGSCVAMFDAGACAPEGSGACSPTQMVTCDGGVAQGCAAGVPERVDCKALADGCTEGIYDSHAPPSIACRNVTTDCTFDKCSVSALTACVRGKNVAIDCVALGLKPCATVTTTPDGPQPACGMP